VGFAERLGATPAQAAIAWVAAQDETIVPLVGARRHDRLEVARGAMRLALTAADLAAIEQVVPRGAAKDDRYPAPAMRDLDSER
jgi:aryl-alcohol dehydrogenase-like predicted oxidoreductase